MRFKGLMLSLCALAFTLPLFGAVSIPKVEGIVSFNGVEVATQANVKMCNSINQCWYGVTDHFGNYQITGASAPEYSTVYFYAWTYSPDGGRTGEWGSEDDYYSTGWSCTSSSQFNPCENLGYQRNFVLYPRPFTPSLVSPANQQANVPLTGLQLSWTDGSDPWRANYTIVYDVYGSGYGIPPALYASNVPCNGRGTCHYDVPSTLYPATYYRWYIKAKLVYAVNHYLTRDSATNSFTTVSTPEMTWSFKTWSRWISAVNGGGYNVNAVPTSIGDFEKFKIVDLNGGNLLNGDQVWIKAPNGMYLTAVGGGGGTLMANVFTNPSANETFTILKQNDGGAGVIVSGDSIALRSFDGVYYIDAVNGGGGDVNCNTTGIGPWETFTLNVNP